MTPRGSFGKPLWFEHKINSKDDIEMIMLIGQMGLEGYGIHWILQEFLASQNGYRAHISTIPALASRYETTSAKVEAVIRGYGLYQIDAYRDMEHPQRSLLEHIRHQNILQGPLQELYLESKLLELIYQTFHNPTLHVYTALCEDDCKALNKAKQILLNDLANPPSLKILARQCALNDFKLKQGFKKLFGTTVYGFVHTKRLEKAKELLEKQEISVQEAALHVGYQSLSHFSKAFKECYHIFPSELKKERKYYLFPSPCMDRGE